MKSIFLHLKADDCGALDSPRPLERVRTLCLSYLLIHDYTGPVRFDLRVDPPPFSLDVGIIIIYT